MKKLIKIVKYCAIILIITPLVVVGESCRFGSCTPSSEMETDIKPGVYPSYNDLTKPVGGFEDEYLEKILLRGIVVDKKCIPVPNTKLLLWQKDEYGKRRYLKRFASEQDRHTMNDHMYSKFVGAGSAVSDSEGRFFFITVDPGSEEKEDNKSKINISAIGKGFISFETQIKLANEIIDKKKNFISAVFNKSASDHYGQKVYDFFIVLNGNSRYTKY
jgi:protocatechuate 3,4-dioxygenase beta subunit